MRLGNWFGVGVRLIGVWEIVGALNEGVTYGNIVMGVFTPSFTAPNAYLTHAIAHLLIGFFLLFFAMSVVKAVYPPTEIDSEDLPSGP